MASLTTVWLDIRKADYEKHQALFSTADGISECETESEDVEMITLSYFDVETEDFDVERNMIEANIPHDKTWDSTLSHPDGMSFFRVLENGQKDFRSFEGDKYETILLREAVAAFEAGNIEAYLNEQKAKKTPLSWEAQDVIIKKREDAFTTLSSIDAHSLAKQVLFRCSELAADGKLNAEDDTMTPNEYAKDINGKGLEHQIKFLLDNGYLVHDVNDLTTANTM